MPEAARRWAANRPNWISLVLPSTGRAVSADAGRAFAFLVLGGNTFGLVAPIVTGYLVEATGSFNSAFILAGALALIGAVVTLALARTPIGEVGVPAAVAAQARRLRLGLYRRTEPQAAAGKSRGGERCGNVGTRFGQGTICASTAGTWIGSFGTKRLACLARFCRNLNWQNNSSSRGQQGTTK